MNHQPTKMTDDQATPLDRWMVETLTDMIFNPKENENEQSNKGDAGVDLPKPESNQKIKP